MIRRPNSTCAMCGKSIYRRPSQIQSGKVFCSLICTGKSQQVQKTCQICGGVYIGNKRTCSRGCANSARAGIRYTGERAKDKALTNSLLKQKIAKLRGGLCERCGEKNYSILQLHHKRERWRDGNDTPSNLELICPNCHMSHHLGFRLFEK